MRNRITRMDLRLLKSGQWVPITADEARPAEMFEAYMSTPHLSCCSMQGGFFIDVDGQPWSDDGTVDEFRMTMGWFDAMTALLAGATTFGPAWIWEQSSLRWTRDGDDVTMLDPGAGTMMWSVTVDLPNLALDFAYHGRTLATWTRAVHELVQQARFRYPALAQRASIIERNLPGPRDLEVIDRLVEWMDPP